MTHHSVYVSYLYDLRCFIVSKYSIMMCKLASFDIHARCFTRIEWMLVRFSNVCYEKEVWYVVKNVCTTCIETEGCIRVSLDRFFFFSHAHFFLLIYVSYQRQQAFFRSKYQLFFPVIQTKMINNDVRKIGDFGNVIYDSGSDTPTGKKRIGISATEIELLDDLPLSTGYQSTSNANNVANRARAFDTQMPSSSAAAATTTKQNSYQTLSLNRGQANGNVVYQSGNDQQLNSAVDQLLEKYAPE